MVLAEALLRVPDAATADRLIEDKLAAGDWSQAERSGAFLVSASAWTLGVTARVIQPGETPENIVESLVKRLGLPTVRLATRQAMRLLGSHFVLGQTIEEALARAGSHREFRYSFDMLGEGARTARRRRALFRGLCRRDRRDRRARRQRRAAGAAGHFGQALGAASALRGGVARARADASSRRACWSWRAHAKRHDLNFTVDAEEADRLELSLDVIARGAGRSVARRLGRLRARGAGLSEARRRGDRLARRHRPHALDRRLMVRLVKGAYWDTEVKRAQERGLADYPVFTRKAMTDLSLHGLHAAAAGGAAAALSAVRHPQRADGRERDRGGGRRRGLRIPAAARHGRGAVRGAARRACRAPRAGSMRRSAAIAICWPIWCGGSWRTAPTPRSSRSPPTRACRSRTILKRPQAWIGDAAPRPASAHSAAARSLPAGAAQFVGRRVRRPRGARRAAGRSATRRAGQG